MFRSVITRAARRPVITAGTRLSRTYPLRWNSSQPSQADDPPPPTPKPLTPEQLKKAALEREDDLQRDWDAKPISYEELLPKTKSPSFVSQEHLILGTIYMYISNVGFISHRRSGTWRSYARHDSIRCESSPLCPWQRPSYSSPGIQKFIRFWQTVVRSRSYFLLP